MITEIKSAIAIPKNSPFTQARTPKVKPPGFLLCAGTHMVFCLRHASRADGQEISFLPDSMHFFILYFLSVLAGFTRNRLINSAII